MLLISWKETPLSPTPLLNEGDERKRFFDSSLLLKEERELSRFSFFLLLLLHHDGVDHGYCRHVDDIVDRTFEVGEVDRLVQTHLDGAYHLAIVDECLDHLVRRVG